MKSKISKQLIEKYFKLTSKALEVVKKNIIMGREKDAGEIILVVEAT